MVKRFFYCMYLFFLLYIVWIMPSDIKPNPEINLVPLKTIHLYVTAFFHGYAPIYVIIGNLIGNIVLFIPIGILFFKYLRQIGLGLILFLSVYIPVFIEIVQLLLHFAEYRTRSIDVDDVLLNMLGIWIGYIVTFIVSTRRSR